jgi:flagellar hook protein FlgE
MPSFSIPLSGLEADSTALNTIANNLANLNTTAFKAQTANFSDLFYQQVGSAGSGDPIQAGAGTLISSISTDFSNGSTSPTGNSSDVALDGTGFFVVQNNGEVEYTRDGTFNVNAEGFLVTQSGLSVLGYPSVNGVVQTQAPLAPIQVPVGQIEAPKATQNLSITANLDANAQAAASSAFTFAGNLDSSGAGSPVTETIPVFDSNGTAQQLTATLTNASPTTWTYVLKLNGVAATAGGTGTLTFNAGTGALATPAAPLTGITFPATTDGANPLNLGWDPSSLTGTASATALTGAAQLGGSAASTTPIPVAVQLFDSLGEAHNATVTFTKDTSAANQWDYEVSLPTADAGGAVGATAAGTLDFSGSGALTRINGVAANTATSVIPLTFAGLSDGAANLNFNWNLFSAAGQPTITQVASASGASATSQDGYAGGQYTGYAIDSNGIVSATFSNSQTTAVGQLGVASVTNLQGLTRLGDNNYATTLASGEASTGVANSGGRGAIQDSALEASNVDISSEFADLIVAQRAFEANSKAVTTFDTVAQETINLIH